MTVLSDCVLLCLWVPKESPWITNCFRLGTFYPPFWNSWIAGSKLRKNIFHLFELQVHGFEEIGSRTHRNASLCKRSVSLVSFWRIAFTRRGTHCASCQILDCPYWCWTFPQFFSASYLPWNCPPFRREVQGTVFELFPGRLGATRRSQNM